MHNIDVDYEWNPAKASLNRSKHGVSFADTTAVFEDPLALTIEDPRHDDERRYLTVGTDSLGRVLVVSFTWREGKIRIISARRATKAERRQYEESP